jgi:hypothetical protein
MPQSKIISRFLTEDGASGTTYSILPADDTPVTFSIIPTGNEVMEIHRCLPFIRDETAFSAEKYGALAALDPGITMSVMRVVNGATATAYTLIEPTHPVQSNADWAAYCFDVVALEFGQGDEFLTARWTFAKSGKPVYLSASKNEWLELTCAGTCTGLVDHHVLIQGYYITQ